jgi:hypothetical protein
MLAPTVLALLIAIAGHAGLRRAAPRLGSVSGFVLVGCLVGAALGVTLFDHWGWRREAWAGLAAYAFACELYIFLFTLVSSSVSVAFLYRLRSGGLPAADGKIMVERRLERMVSGGILEKTAAGYRHTARGARLLRTYRCFRTFFRRAAFAR